MGTLRPLWETLYPTCFDEYDNSVCSRPYLSYQSITYSVVLGVMVGMVVLGVLANNIGRRMGSIITASLMALGSVLLTSSSVFLSNNPSALFPAMSLSLFVFGVGVGGEYPLSASSASERAMATMKRRMKHELNHRQKMKRMLLSSSNVGDGNPTPVRSNLTNRNADGGKQESLLRANADVAANAIPWQTLEYSENAYNSKLTPVAEESYGNIPPSPTNDTNNSLSTHKSSLRTRGREVLLVFSMQGMGILANSLILTFLLMVARKNGDENENDDDDAGYKHEANVHYEPSTLVNIWRITYATGAGILIYVLVSRVSHLTESEVWAEDRQQQEEDRSERRRREAGVDFRPPHPVGQNENRLRKQVVDRRDGEARPDQPVISPTMSSITMKSEFDLLGSTNLDGCKILPAMIDGDEYDDRRSSSSKKSPNSEMVLLFRHYGVRLFGTSITWLLWDIGKFARERRHVLMLSFSQISVLSQLYRSYLFIFPFSILREQAFPIKLFDCSDGRGRLFN